MIALSQLDELLPLACIWAEEQEKYIIENGISLNSKQQSDAQLIGVKEISKVRLLKVDKMPSPTIPELKKAAELTGLLSTATIGITFRYGIYIKKEFGMKEDWLHMN